ncbi:hypothetical protein ACOSQ4_005735 [Xanthoceras sorbifolium]
MQIKALARSSSSHTLLQYPDLQIQTTISLHIYPTTLSTQDTSLSDHLSSISDNFTHFNTQTDHQSL